MTDRSNRLAARLAALVLAVLMLPGVPITLHAQTAPAAQPAAGAVLAKEEIEAITRAVTEQVLKELDARQKQGAGVGAPAPSETLPEASTIESEEAALAQAFRDESTAAAGMLIKTLAALPSLAATMGHVLYSMVVPQPGGRSALAFLAILAVTFAAALLAAAAYALVRRLLPVSDPPPGEDMPLVAILRLALADIAALAAVGFICNAVGGHLFNSDDPQSVVAQWLLFLLTRFAFFRMVFDIWFRPNLAAARLVPLDDGHARGAYGFFSVLAFILVIRTWISIPMTAGAEPHAIAAGLLINNAMFVGLFFWAALRWRESIAAWIRDGKPASETSSVVNWLARCWVGLSGALVVLLSVTHAYGAVHLYQGVSAGLTWTLRIVLLMIFGAALVQFLSRRLMKPAAAGETGTRRQRAAIILGRIARIGIVAAAAGVLSEMWLVDVLKLRSAGEWGSLTQFLTMPLIGLLVGYLAVQGVRYIADSYLEASANATAAKAAAGQGMALASSSRLRTLVPVLRLVAMWAIALVTGLLVLHAMGVNITPLLAGASVAGLAISFGSQSLVKDIVSGFFFLADDAFRVGEYIECGKAKGTVEGFTLRSIRLRHQDGQLHTVPFGQLGEITNYSRDWATVKFEVMLDREVDLEKVRKVAKRIGLALKEDERFKDQILSPLKLQGITNVTDSSVTVRFKYNVLPGSPVELERLAKVKLLTALREDGLLIRYVPAAPAASASGIVLGRQDAGATAG
jgi:small-conductance mechanosensitive channel